jgi:hypothetical protein
MYLIVLSARTVHRLVEYYRVHSPTSQLSIVIHVMSGNPIYGILDRVPYIDVLHVWDNASGMVRRGVSLNTTCKVQDKVHACPV